MNDGLTYSLVTRARPPEGFARMLGASLLAHAVLVTALLVSGLLPSRAVEEEKTLMTISLGGAPGPRSGGMTSLGGRPVQKVAPKAEPARPEPVRPPAERAPAMTVPEWSPAKAPARKEPVKTEPARKEPAAPAGAVTGPPTTGPELQRGNAVAETGGRGIGFGLSTGGGGTGGEINLGNFCCPDYLTTLLDLVQRNWNSHQQVDGVATIRFTVERDGRISEAIVARTSGYSVLDLAAQRAIMMTRLPPLPSAYSNEQLTIHLNFQYQR